ncbi:MAG: helix-turn-helix domain-containing protein [Desulfobacteraceae bacterium]|nr:helix-turn-helix domain-containing protein [Desulfobacteraceae bacterium]
MKGDEQILIGIRQIQQVLGGVSENTVLKWVREYKTIPITKIGGQWTSMRDELRRWWQHLVTNTLAEYVPAVQANGNNQTKGQNDDERKAETAIKSGNGSRRPARSKDTRKPGRLSGDQVPIVRRGDFSAGHQNQKSFGIDEFIGAGQVFSRAGGSLHER